MYTGHFAVALAGAGVARRVPLGLLAVAAFAADLVEAVYAAFGRNDVTRVWSHSIPATLAIGLVFGLAWRVRGGSWAEGALLCFVATSHTALDFVTGVKAWWPGQPPAGFALYGRPAYDLPLELAMVGVAWLIWRAALPPNRRFSPPALAMLGVLVLAQGLATAYVVLGGGADLTALSKFLR